MCLAAILRVPWTMAGLTCWLHSAGKAAHHQQSRRGHVPGTGSSARASTAVSMAIQLGRQEPGSVSQVTVDSGIIGSAEFLPKPRRQNLDNVSERTARTMAAVPKHCAAWQSCRQQCSIYQISSSSVHHRQQFSIYQQCSVHQCYTVCHASYKSSVNKWEPSRIQGPQAQMFQDANMNVKSAPAGTSL